MREIFALAAGWAAGAATMYYLDPHGGRRRRSAARDKLVAWSHDAGHVARRSSRRALARMRGMAAERRAHRHAQPPHDDHQLLERVRARLGHAISYPGAIDVEAQDGRITLRGPALAEDIASLVDAVRGVAGVTDVENLLTVHDEPAHVPELQGARRGRSPSALTSALAALAIVAPTALVLGAAGLGAMRGTNGR